MAEHKKLAASFVFSVSPAYFCALGVSDTSQFDKIRIGNSDEIDDQQPARDPQNET